MSADGGEAVPARVDALLVDFNGTLSQDEDVLFEVYALMGAERGVALSRGRYLDAYAGRSDAEIFEAMLGAGVDTSALTARRIELYRSRVADGSTIGPPAREALAYAATRVPVAIVTSAWRTEVAPVLRAADVERYVAVSVCADDVTREKPDPEGYALACRRLGVAPSHALAIEDTEAGIAAARAAGVRCVAVTSTLPAGRLAAADELIEGLTVAQLARLLGSAG